VTFCLTPRVVGDFVLSGSTISVYAYIGQLVIFLSSLNYNILCVPSFANFPTKVSRFKSVRLFKTFGLQITVIRKHSLLELCSRSDWRFELATSLPIVSSAQRYIVIALDDLMKAIDSEHSEDIQTWPPTLTPSKPTWTVSMPVKSATVRIYHRRLILFIYLFHYIIVYRVQTSVQIKYKRIKIIKN